MSELEKILEDVRPLADRLWGQLAVLRREYDRPRIMVAGAEPGVGNTLVCAATALGLARNLRQEVRLIETNLARPGLADLLEVPRGPGLSDVLDHRATLDQAFQRLTSCPDLGVIAAGSPRSVLPGEFATEEVRTLLAEASAGADFTILDAAPIPSREGSRLLLDAVDGIVLVVRARSSRIEGVREAMEIAETAGVPIIGSVLNRYKSDVPFGLD